MKMIKKSLLLISLLLSLGITISNAQENSNAGTIKPSPPNNNFSAKQCTLKGGIVFNTLDGKPDGTVIGKVTGLRCPCVCVLKKKPDNTLWVEKNGSMVKFTGNLKEIKNFNDCKKAGFRVTGASPAICTVGKPYMTGGRYKTFVNHPMLPKTRCNDYTYSSCPGKCVASCKPSSCTKPDKFGAVICTSDCDGKGSCVAR